MRLSRIKCCLLKICCLLIERTKSYMLLFQENFFFIAAFFVRIVLIIFCDQWNMTDINDIEHKKRLRQLRAKFVFSRGENRL